MQSDWFCSFLINLVCGLVVAVAVVVAQVPDAKLQHERTLDFYNNKRLQSLEAIFVNKELFAFFLNANSIFFLVLYSVVLSELTETRPFVKRS